MHHPPKSFQQWSNRHPTLAQKISLPENFAFWPPQPVVVQPEASHSCRYQQQLPPAADKLLLQHQLMQHRLLQKTRQSTTRKAVNVKPYYLPPFQVAMLPGGGGVPLPPALSCGGPQVPSTCASGELYNPLFSANQPPPTIDEDEALSGELAAAPMPVMESDSFQPQLLPCAAADKLLLQQQLLQHREVEAAMQPTLGVENNSEAFPNFSDQEGSWNPLGLQDSPPEIVATANGSLPPSPPATEGTDPAVVWKPMAAAAYTVETLPSYMAHSCRLNEEAVSSHDVQEA